MFIVPAANTTCFLFFCMNPETPFISHQNLIGVHTLTAFRPSRIVLLIPRVHTAAIAHFHSNRFRLYFSPTPAGIMICCGVPSITTPADRIDLTFMFSAYLKDICRSSIPVPTLIPKIRLTGLALHQIPPAVCICPITVDMSIFCMAFGAG